VGAAVMIAQRVPPGFIPNEDQGVFYVSVTSPPGATLERTKEVVNAIAAAARDVDDIESIATLAGTNVLSDGTGATYGTCIVNLKPWEARSQSVEEVIDTLEQRVRHIQAADLEFFPPPAVPGYGNASGFELRVLDKTGRDDFNEMQGVVDQFVADLESRPEIESAFTIFSANYPQYTIDIDIDKAAQKGVTISDALGTLQTFLGSEYATNFIRFGQMYKVMVQAPPEYRAEPEHVLELRVRSDNGELVPLSAFVTLEKFYGVDQITRYNMYPSAELNGTGLPGLSSGDVLRAVQETADETLPSGFAISWAGISLDEVDAGNQGLWVGLVALLFVYLVLAAQYESFILPVTVLLSLPPGLFGALGLLDLAGLENNIYTHIALVVLIGLLGKNAILIVEYAEAEYRSGRAVRQAVLQAARLRLRPILMTSLAFVAGLIPLASASGAGEVANRTIGTATIGGMVMGTFWGLFLVPGLYIITKRLQQRRAPRSAEAQTHEDGGAVESGEVG
jgi:HAE1 family hydrophobic/amphiphilic exporter-1